MTVQRKRLGCWFYVAVVAIALNPFVWRLGLNLIQLAVQYFAVHVRYSCRSFLWRGFVG